MNGGFLAYSIFLGMSNALSLELGGELALLDSYIWTLILSAPGHDCHQQKPCSLLLHMPPSIIFSSDLDVSVE